MTNLQTLLTEAAKLNHEISRLLKVSTYSDYGDLSELDIDAHNGEQIFLRDELTYIMQKLSDAAGNRISEPPDRESQPPAQERLRAI